MTEGYTLVMNKPLFAGVFFGSVLLTVILYLIFRKGFLTFTVPLVGLAAAVGVSIPFDDIADIAYHAFLPVVITAGREHDILCAACQEQHDFCRERGTS